MNLVVQQMSDEALIVALKKLRSHLTGRGVIRIQFAVPYQPLSFIWDSSLNSLDSCKSGSNVRNFQQIYDLVLKHGFNIRDARITSIYPEHNSAHLCLMLCINRNKIRHIIAGWKMRSYQKRTILAPYIEIPKVRSLGLFLIKQLRKMKK